MATIADARRENPDLATSCQVIYVARWFYTVRVRMHRMIQKLILDHLKNNFGRY